MTIASITALAHAGTHELTTGDGIVHALTAPDHLLAAAACVAGAYAAYAVYRRLASNKARVAENRTSSSCETERR